MSCLPQTLGRLGGPPTAEANDKVKLEYKTSSPCPGSPQKTISSVITFICAENKVCEIRRRLGNNSMRRNIKNTSFRSQGSPHLVASDNCTYEFEFATSAVCHDQKKVTPTTSDSCIIDHPPTGSRIDLSALKGKAYQVLSIHRAPP